MTWTHVGKSNQSSGSIAGVGDSGDYAHCVGHRFPGGRYVLPPHEAWLWADAVGAATDDPVAHPGLAYMVGLHGGGASIADIMALLNSDPASGVLFGELEMRFDRPLLPGGAYRVEGEILAVERKRGRSLGTFDLATFEHRIAEEQSGDVVVTVKHVWVFPRADAE